MTKLPHDHGTSEKYLEARPSEENFGRASEVFSMISDSTRMKILWLLCHNEECVLNIAAAIDMSSPAVSHHLKILKSAGLVVSHREGKEVYYTLSETKEAEVVHQALDQMLNLACSRKE